MHQGRITLDKDTAPDERTDAPEDNTELVNTERCGRGCHALRVAQYSVPLKGSPRYLALSKWRDRYQADHPTWTQALSRRPETSPAHLAAHIEEEIVHLRHALLPQGAGPASAAAIQQVLQDNAIAPVPSLRTIYRVLQRRAKEVTQPTSMT